MLAEAGREECVQQGGRDDARASSQPALVQEEAPSLGDAILRGAQQRQISKLDLTLFTRSSETVKDS